MGAIRVTKRWFGAGVGRKKLMTGSIAKTLVFQGNSKRNPASPTFCSTPDPDPIYKFGGSSCGSLQKEKEEKLVAYLV